ETAKSSLGLSGAIHGWDYSFSAGATSAKGFNATRRHTANNASNFSYGADDDGYRSHSLSGTLGYTWATGHRIGLTGYDNYLDADTDNGSTIPDSYGLSRQQAYSLSSTDRITNWWNSDLRAGFTKEGYDDRAF